MYNYTERIYGDSQPGAQQALLGADIGGTNSNFGFFSVVDGRPRLLFSRHTKSQQITHFTDVVADILEYAKERYQITVSRACFAAAGVVSANNDYCKPTNVDLVIDARDIMARTGLKYAYIVNDFQVVGYGLDLIDPQDLVQVKPGVARPGANRAIVGAGTGLGKTILTWNRSVNRYVPLASEGGHADFAAQTQIEFDLTTYIKTHASNNCNVSWEDVLSGDGIQRIYSFFKNRNGHAAAAPYLIENGLHPDKIFHVRNEDEHSRDTFALYAQVYARCAKNFALDALALGGVYIAGGIAAKNLSLFRQRSFLREFINCGKQQKILQDIPIYVITDYNVSLFGAAHYLLFEGE